VKLEEANLTAHDDVRKRLATPHLSLDLNCELGLPPVRAQGLIAQNNFGVVIVCKRLVIPVTRWSQFTQLAIEASLRNNGRRSIQSTFVSLARRIVLAGSIENVATRFVELSQSRVPFVCARQLSGQLNCMLVSF
jgi:hypothetical protein